MRNQPPREYTLVDMARAFCIAAHTAVTQKRKYTGEDYHHHPEEALQILLTYCEPTWEQQAAILLHDVVEDTGVELKYIAQIFGQEVARLVDGVTDVSRKEDGNRAERKRIDREHIVKGGKAIYEIKLADLISNSRSIVKHDPKFAKTYLDEKICILRALYLPMKTAPIYFEAFTVAIDGLKELYGENHKLFDYIDYDVPNGLRFGRFLTHYQSEAFHVEVQSTDSVTPE